MRLFDEIHPLFVGMIIGAWLTIIFFGVMMLIGAQ